MDGINGYTYPNGLQVVLIPAQSQPTITVNMTYFVGSRHEAYGEAGLAHVMEHMLFLKCKDGRDVRKELAAHGGRGNGTTSWDRTSYFETIPASVSNLEWVIRLETDRMNNILIDRQHLSSELQVIRNEFQMLGNSVGHTLQQRTLRVAFTKHNYGNMPEGYGSDIEHVSPARLAEFYRTYYRPDNAFLVIAGGFAEADALARIKATLGAVARPLRPLEPTRAIEPPQDGARSVHLDRVEGNEQIAVIYHIPAAAHPDMAALDVLTTLLGDGASGRLRRLIGQRKAVAASMVVQELHDPGFALAEIRLGQNQSLEEARGAALRTIEGLGEEPPSSEEVESAKAKLLKELSLDLTDARGLALMLNEYAASGDWRSLFLERDKIRNVTPADVIRVAKAYFKPCNRTIGESVRSATADRVEIPMVQATAATAFKNPTSHEAVAEGESFNPTPHNIEDRIVRRAIADGPRIVLLAKRTRQARVLVRITLELGDAKSLAGLASTGRLAAGMLLRGAKTRGRQQIQDELDRLNSRFQIFGGADKVVGIIETTETNLPGALRLMTEILRTPSFPQLEFDELKQQQAAALKESERDPGMLARAELAQCLENTTGGIGRELEELGKVTVDDVRDFHARFYGASSATIVVSGQFSAPLIEKLATGLFADWKSASVYERAIGLYRLAEPVNREIKTPANENAMFLAGVNLRMSDDDPGYAAMLIANYAFGGSSASRLFRRIRDREGLSYSVGSTLAVAPKSDAARFTISAIASPRNVPKLEAMIKDELTRVQGTGFDRGEAAAAKKAWLQEQLMRRSQDEGLAAVLTERERVGRTMHWDEAFEAKVAALTAEQISAAFRRLHPDEFVYVKAGAF